MKNKKFDNKVTEFRDFLLDEIYDLFKKHAKKDNLGELSIQSGDMSDESIYLMLKFEPEYCDGIEEEVTCLSEIIEFWYNMGEIDVNTFEHGSMHINNLSIDDLMRCHEYLMYLENETN